ncbi:MAG: flagellar transcriptional regulator FlhD [Rhodocyclaceae bacterium]|nr:flagellar transcriptional regulator FlhD [Opitutaceae bacterium]MCL4682808.1 flagellar transcriptional regulator FlhD [Rhodocyclaceae bacterium]
MIAESNELHALNYRFLLVLQREARQSVAAASRIFGVDEAACADIAVMSLDTIEELAKTNALVFRGRIDRSTLALLGATASPGVRAVLVESRAG